MSVYQINKGVNAAIEFKGLKAQYISYLAVGLVSLLLLFAILYLIHVPVFICLLSITGLGCLLFRQVFYLSNTYGQYGLMKRGARRYLPKYIRFTSRTIFTSLK